MKPPAFDYMVAKSIADASAALLVEGAFAVAGGQSLLPMLSLRVAAPDRLIDIGRLAELRESSKSASAVRLGALTTHADAEDGNIPDSFAGLLPRVASGISYRAVRNFGTIGGSVALADPAADWPVCLLALGADVRVAMPSGVRSEAIDDLLQGQYTTSLDRGEIILGFDIAPPGPGFRSGYCKVARKSGAYANSIAMAVQRGRDGPISIALGAAADRALLLSATAERLKAGERAAESLRAAIRDDLNAHAVEADDYLTRLHVSTVLRAVQEMLSR